MILSHREGCRGNADVAVYAVRTNHIDVAANCACAATCRTHLEGQDIACHAHRRIAAGLCQCHVHPIAVGEVTINHDWIGTKDCSNNHIAAKQTIIRAEQTFDLGCLNTATCRTCRIIQRDIGGKGGVHRDRRWHDNPHSHCTATGCSG